MRTAICFAGKTGGSKGQNNKGGFVDLDLVYSYYKKNVINGNNCDIFIHNWDPETKEKFNGLFKPKASIFEEQIDFHDKAIKHHQIRYWMAEYGNTKNLLRKLKIKIDKRLEIKINYAEKVISRYYSILKSVELMKNYELKNNFKYDIVILTRPDHIFLNSLKFEQFSPLKFYVSNWNRKPVIDSYGNTLLNLRNDGVSDAWFISSSDNIDCFSKLLHHYLDYDVLNAHFMAFQHIMKCNLTLEKKLYEYIDSILVRRM